MAEWAWGRSQDHLGTRSVRARRSRGRYSRRSKLQWRKEGQEEQLALGSRGPGTGGERPWTIKSHGQSFGRHTESPSWFGQCMTSYLAQWTSSPGEKTLKEIFRKRNLGAHTEFFPKALSKGCYTWCHNHVLKPIAEAISKRISNCTGGVAPVRSLLPRQRSSQGQDTRGRDPVNCSGLAALCRSWKAAEIPPAHCQHLSEARYSSGLRDHQEHHPHGADCAVGGPDEGCPWQEEDPIQTPGHQLLGAGLEGKLNAHWGWLQGHCFHKALSALGIRGTARSRAIKNTNKEAKKASKWLWIWRGQPWEQVNAT